MSKIHDIVNTFNKHALANNYIYFTLIQNFYNLLEFFY